MGNTIAGIDILQNSGSILFGIIAIDNNFKEFGNLDQKVVQTWSLLKKHCCVGISWNQL